MTRSLLGLGLALLGLALVLLLGCVQAQKARAATTAGGDVESLESVFPKKFDLPQPLALHLKPRRKAVALRESLSSAEKAFAKRFVLPAPFPLPSLDSLRPIESTERFRKKLVMPDPMEKGNRIGFKIAIMLDKYTTRPIARAWGKIPRPLTAPIVNVGRNLSRPVSFANSILQGHPKEAVKTMFAFLIDTVLGFGGLVAVSKGIGLDDRREDFGQTLGVYGAGHFAYFPVPLIGPTSIRDLSAQVVDPYLNPFNYVLPVYNQGLSAALGIISGLDAYARALPFIEAVERNTLDPYAALRDFYARSRALQVLNADSRKDSSPEQNPYEGDDPFGDSGDSFGEP